MMATAREVVMEELIQWLEREDYERLSRPQRIPQLEDAAHIWEYGKWSLKGGFDRLGYKPQIRFRGARPESTVWDSIPDISDELGMKIHAAIMLLSDDAIQILHLVYIHWYTVDAAAKEMCIRRQTFFDIRWAALETIAKKLVDAGTDFS